MFDRLRNGVLRLLRVPAEPQPPAGDPLTIRTFRAAPHFFRYRLALWGLGQLAAIAGLMIGAVAIRIAKFRIEPSGAVLFVHAVEVMAWMVFVAQAVFGYAVLRLDFEMRWYILSDRSLRIREGILAVREKTMTFANIQQIAVRQNPLQRLLRIADVEVRTAGGGASAGHGGAKSAAGGMHEAYFRGVENAAQIRDAIRERVRQHRDAGLGDPDEREPTAVGGGAPALAAARELLEEVRRLRGALPARVS